jgi:hypothetical protein
VAEEGRGENEVMQPANPTANAAANAPANPAANALANAPISVTANAADNVANNTANAANVQRDAAANPWQNAEAQPPPVQTNRAEGSQCQRIRDKVKIAQRANYDRDHGVPNALDANNPIQETELRQMRDQEHLRRAQYDQDNGPPDNLYIIPTAYAPSVSPGAVNTFHAFSQRLQTIRYPKDPKNILTLIILHNSKRGRNLKELLSPLMSNLISPFPMLMVAQRVLMKGLPKMSGDFSLSPISSTTK